MSHWESAGKSDEWYTPKYIFDALGCDFDMDVAAPEFGAPHVPARSWLSKETSGHPWEGFVWMNPPFGGRNSLTPWLDKFFAHGNGIALVPDRTSAPWWQAAARRSASILFISPKVKFERPDGTTGDSPSTGTALLGIGAAATVALNRAQWRGLGLIVRPMTAIYA